MLLMIGANWKIRCLIVPYLTTQMLVILLTMVLGILLPRYLFMINHNNDGYFISLFVLVTLVLSLFSWKTVNEAYVKLKRKPLDGCNTIDFDEDLQGSDTDDCFEGVKMKELSPRGLNYEKNIR